MSKKPIIGISGSVHISEKGLFAGHRRACVGNNYVEAVIAAGGIPFIIPINADEDVIRGAVDAIDALIMSGGHDVSPICYNEEPMQKLEATFLERDKFDSLLISEAQKKGKPILGICRGVQILNVVNGGTLYQDVSYAKDVFIQHFQKTKSDDLSHSVKIDKNSFLGDIFDGEETGLINSFHHQILKDVAPGFRVIAQSPDGAIEGIQKDCDNNLIVGLQWHPELLAANNIPAQKIFKKFIKYVTEK